MGLKSVVTCACFLLSLSEEWDRILSATLSPPIRLITKKMASFQKKII